MRSAISLAVATLLVIPVGVSLTTAPAMANSLRAERDNILRALASGVIEGRRAACAVGNIPDKQARLTAAGFSALSPGAYCVTVLTRAGRDGTLGYARDNRASQGTPAIAFDTGFVSGYSKRDAVPSTAPGMAALLPVADRCLDQKEPNARLCSTVGYVLGTRAAWGELVPLPSER